jgi:hypothetical protein
VRGGEEFRPELGVSDDGGEILSRICLRRSSALEGCSSPLLNSSSNLENAVTPLIRKIPLNVT